MKTESGCRKILTMSGKAHVFFLWFQGSKGDPGMTGPTGAAGLPVSLVGSEAPPARVPHHRSTVKTEYPGPGVKNLGPSEEKSHLCDR